MVVLKKLKASTLMETMVATVLIVIIFTVASLVMNSHLRALAQNNTGPLTQKMHQLEYQALHQQLELPAAVEWESWGIAVEMEEKKLIIHARHSETGQTLMREIYP